MDRKGRHVERASKIKRLTLEPLQAQDAVNTFQRCKALLNAESSASLAVVQRFEVDSKFFRCFAVVLLLLLIAWPWQGQWPPVCILAVLVLLLPGDELDDVIRKLIEIRDT